MTELTEKTTKLVRTLLAKVKSGDMGIISYDLNHLDITSLLEVFTLLKNKQGNWQLSFEIDGTESTLHVSDKKTCQELAELAYNKERDQVEALNLRNLNKMLEMLG